MSVQKVNLKPANGRVIVARKKQEERTAGGILIPDTAKEKPSRGTVIAISEGTLLKNGEMRPSRFRVGDEVFFGKYAGNAIPVEGYGEDECLVLSEDDILAKVAA